MSDIMVFMRAHSNHDLKDKPVDILCPLGSFKIIIKNETCYLRVLMGGEVTSNFSLANYYMSEKQYNTLLLALKSPAPALEGYVLDASVNREII